MSIYGELLEKGLEGFWRTIIVLCIFAIIGICSAIAMICYAIFKVVT